MATSQRNRVLVLGGTGFIGRNLVDYLVRSNVAEKIRVVDKVPPQMAWLNPKHAESFADPVVEFCHANLISKASAEKAFSDESGAFDYVINFAAETKFGQSEPVYKDGIYRLSLNCAELAARQRAKRYIEVSTAQIYSCDKKSASESSKCEPWTTMAKHKLDVDKVLESFVDLDFCIVRPSIVYGPGDRNGLTPRIMVGAIYKYIQRDMHLLWSKDLRMNTVHVLDVVRAVWHLCLHGNRGQVYNLSDKGDTSQGLISNLVAELFNINYSFLGSTFSNLARVRMNDTVNEINERHMRPWSDACQRDGITNTPLNPFIDKELLYNKHLHVDGSKIESLGFEYTIPHLQIQHLREVLDDYIVVGLIPRSLVSNDTIYTGQVEGFPSQEDLLKEGDIAEENEEDEVEQKSTL